MAINDASFEDTSAKESAVARSKARCDARSSSSSAEAVGRRSKDGRWRLCRRLPVFSASRGGVASAHRFGSGCTTRGLLLRLPRADRGVCLRAPHYYLCRLRLKEHAQAVVLPPPTSLRNCSSTRVEASKHVSVEA